MQKTLGKYERVLNFAGGPSSLPMEVLETIHDENFNWNKTGVSIMEYVYKFIKKSLIF